jgi:hypothetical protein
LENLHAMFVGVSHDHALVNEQEQGQEQEQEMKTQQLQVSRQDFGT